MEPVELIGKPRVLKVKRGKVKKGKVIKVKKPTKKPQKDECIIG